MSENLLSRIGHNRFAKPILFFWVICLLLSVVASQSLADTADDRRHHSAAEQIKASNNGPDCPMDRDTAPPHTDASLGGGCCHDVNQGETFPGEGIHAAFLDAHSKAVPTRSLSFSSIHPTLLYRPPIQ